MNDVYKDLEELDLIYSGKYRNINAYYSYWNTGRKKMKTKPKSVKTTKETKTTFTQLEEELGFDIVNSIFGFRTFEGKELGLQKECKYFFASLLFSHISDRRKDLIKDIKTYFAMMHNSTPIEWIVIVRKYEDYLDVYSTARLHEYDKNLQYQENFDIR